ncbi:MAG: HsdR family type I site-specific deoxyribonuclease [Clostridia bacterium]|nr:HsdR family type I site-specific deoxyribonuclease [Clostridia bacterium]
MPINEASWENKVIETISSLGWKYIPAEELPRNYSDIMVEKYLKSALIRLNPEIFQNPSYADQVIYKLRTFFLETETHNLIDLNERFREFVLEHNSFPFGQNGKSVPVQIFGTLSKGNVDQNEYVVTNQWVYPEVEGGKRLDIVLLVNGIPMVIGELKTPVQEGITYLDAIKDIRDYENSIPKMFTASILNFATEGKCYRYAAVKSPIQYWGPWYNRNHKKEGTLIDVLKSIKDMLVPEKIMDIFEFYTLFSTSGEDFQKYKVICRYQQFEGANAIVNRVRAGSPKKGLIWHFQGSGKSYLMLFAAKKLRSLPELNNPTVIVVDDRVDLESQTSGVFTNANVPNLESASTIKELTDDLKGDLRKIIITTIFRFKDATKPLNYSSNIILLCDECHRTQEGDLGKCMRTALPNAFFFGLTGTPINQLYRNTFETFGSVEDPDNYMSKYDYYDSIRDKATLPLKFESVPVDLKIDKDKIINGLKEVVGELSEEEQSKLAAKLTLAAIVKAQDRIEKVCKHIYEHYKSKIEPTGLKGQVVCYDRDCCVRYKKEFDKLFGNEDSTIIVMDTHNDKADDYKEYRLSKDEEEHILNRFRDKNDPIKLVIVTSKLLTGFDAPILQVMYLDKPMRNHTLLQAVCRTNRLFGQTKTYGLIVDYFGLFDEVAKAFTFDDEKMRKIVENVDGVKEDFKKYYYICLNYFLGIDRTSDGVETLMDAQERLVNEKVREEFGSNYRALSRAYEIISPDTFLNPYAKDYKWLSKVYASIRPTDNSKLIWALHGTKTLELVQGSVNVEQIHDSIDVLLSGQIVQEVVDKALAAKKAALIKINIEAVLHVHEGDPKYQKLAERMEELKNKYSQGLIDSVEFMKQLCELATDIRQVEKYGEPKPVQVDGKKVLTRLFNEVKNKQTPAMVEKIVDDIDRIVTITRFPGWQQSKSGKNEVNNALMGILFGKYRIRDVELFDKAMEYIIKYY